MLSDCIQPMLTSLQLSLKIPLEKCPVGLDQNNLCHLDEAETRFDNCNLGSLSSEQNNQYWSLMEQSFKSIDANYVAPKWDGNKFY
jgi:hypothetical protein